MNFTKKGDDLGMASPHKTDFTEMDKNIKGEYNAMRIAGVFSNRNKRLQKIADSLGLKKEDLMHVRDNNNPQVKTTINKDLGF
jgi:hypothetical protein